MGKLPKSLLGWYGGKLLHKITISGAPNQDKIDKFFHNERVFFEESILLVKASSFDKAYQIAEKAAKNADEVYENKYGQTVKHEFYQSIDCFHLFDSPKSNLKEAYSTFFQKEQGDNEKSTLNQRYHNCTGEELHLLRHR